MYLLNISQYIVLSEYFKPHTLQYQKHKNRQSDISLHDLLHDNEKLVNRIPLMKNMWTEEELSLAWKLLCELNLNDKELSKRFYDRIFADCGPPNTANKVSSRYEVAKSIKIM